MSCDIFWKYELPITIDITQFSTKYSNQTEQDVFQKLSHFLCHRMKLFIQDDLINTGRRHLLSTLDLLYPHFHIHGLSSHDIFFTPLHTIFICTHSFHLHLHLQ